MTEFHVHIELVLLIVGGSLCSAFLIAVLVLLAYEDLRKMWKEIRGPGEFSGPVIVWLETEPVAKRET